MSKNKETVISPEEKLTQDKIVEILKKELNYIYCSNCSSNEYSESCDDCHRKSMNWSISNGCAEGLAKEILKTIKETNSICQN